MKRQNNRPDRAAVTPTRARSWAWIAWSLAAVPPAIGYFAAPETDATARAVLYCLVSAGSAVALAVGVRLHRPRVSSIWWLLALGQVMYSGGDVAYFLAAAQGESSYPLLANVLYLAQYVFVGAALVVLNRRRAPKRNTAALIDTAIVAVGAAVLWWVLLVAPMVTVPGVSAQDRLLATVYPVMDVCVLAAAIRLLLGGGVRQAAQHLLLGFLGLTLLGDAAYGVLTLAGSFTDGGWPDAVWLLGYLALGAAGLHPSMRRLSDPVEERSGATLFRVMLLGAATAIAPAMLVVQNLRQTDSSDLVVVVASAVLFLLVLGRMAGLIAAQRRIAITDGLTGLYTRRFLSETMRVESERAVRHGSSFALLLLDVDHFKTINDTYGHPAGDRVLVEIARRLKDACRGTDVVARYGGEEFAVLVTSTVPDGLDCLAERLRDRIGSTPIRVDGRTAVGVTVSVGAAALPPHAVSPDQVVKAADNALYGAKRAGRNRVVVGDPTRDGEPTVAGDGDAADPDELELRIQRWTHTVIGALQGRAAAPSVPASMVAGVCAAWAVMRTPRLGHPGLSREHARTELRRCRGVQFHPEAVDAFLSLEAADAVGSTPTAGPAPLIMAR
ncbi:diguanylate cyclase (GGDEF)-like protein [Krasilnikovia cinnamomea]|uniref:Diguanylate cyclase (GGDEF)-like protein n=1 Tax=Krasilnikovia cinnamomea TaxID=349313 RepID=A0A4Q7ZTM9_9ACTN|nr:GGDEF domain-containing protein [Krasilnikovia cinnamomea]RZU54231.1 diguanylate cyclase (GGDEF)-like protein [Krasilnikovia cinnamomea]